MLIHTSDEEDIYNRYCKLAELYKNSAFFYHTDNIELRKYFEIKSNLGFYSVTPQEILKYSGKYAANSMLTFVKNNAGDWFFDWHENYAVRVFLHKIPTLLYFNSTN